MARDWWLYFPQCAEGDAGDRQFRETAYDKDEPVLVAYDTRFLADQFARTAAGYWQSWVGR